MVCERCYDLVTIFTGVLAGWVLNVVTKEKIITELLPPENREQNGHIGHYGHTMTFPKCPIFPFTNYLLEPNR